MLAWMAFALFFVWETRVRGSHNLCKCQDKIFTLSDDTDCVWRCESDENSSSNMVTRGSQSGWSSKKWKSGKASCGRVDCGWVARRNLAKSEMTELAKFRHHFWLCVWWEIVSRMLKCSLSLEIERIETTNEETISHSLSSMSLTSLATRTRQPLIFIMIFPRRWLAFCNIIFDIWGVERKTRAPEANHSNLSWTSVLDENTTLKRPVLHRKNRSEWIKSNVVETQSMYANRPWSDTRSFCVFFSTSLSS